VGAWLDACSRAGWLDHFAMPELGASAISALPQGYAQNAVPE
jgi:hypothetical protein